ncbi:transglutaminaseTgpA domain-containing protein [Salinibacterium amurskyense]|uniref:transglutaminase family protein n=1 Tax=Salinibacterium amurskyense TaxID=205941 RepID=UPI00312045C9
MTTTEASRARSLRAHERRVRIWSLSGTLALALGVAASSLGEVLTEGAWWFPYIGVVIVVLAVAAVAHTLIARAWIGSLVGAAAGLATLTLFFAPATAIVGIIPTIDTFDRFGALIAQGQSSMESQRFPADADTGIVFLICLGAVGLSVAMDAIAFVLRRPALTALPLLIMLAVPAFVRSELHDAFGFAVTALAYAGILLVAEERTTVRAAWPVVASALVLALIVPVLLPSVEPGESSSGATGLISTGVNPILNLSDDLRRDSALLALTYFSDEGDEYLRVAALDEFSDETWSPSERELDDANTVDEFAPAQGLSDEVPRTESVMQIQIQRLRGKLLPVPYAATSITDVGRGWVWEPEGLTVASSFANSKDANYEVSYITPAPTIEQLEAAPTELPAGFEKYLALPESLPAVVAETAQQVAGAEATRFDQALALQKFFRNGDFTYSEEAPVAEDYDGSGAEVLGEFLSAQSGYCVHFASAMAAMARSLDIPARVVVGFTPGQRQVNSETDEVRYAVTTDNLHSWPELYFPTVGWVRFEPTTSVGSTPRFAQSVNDDPSTPDVDESKPEPTATPTSSATPGARPDVPRDEIPDNSTPGETQISPWWLLLLAIPFLLAIPALVRAVRRGLRLRAVGRGNVALAWREICDSAADLGVAVSRNATPRQQYEQLAAQLGLVASRAGSSSSSSSASSSSSSSAASSALAAVLAAVEASAFSPHPQPVRREAVTSVLASLRSSAGWKERIAATLAPRTAFDR